jgi:hypothetical protein
MVGGPLQSSKHFLLHDLFGFRAVWLGHLLSAVQIYSVSNTVRVIQKQSTTNRRYGSQLITLETATLAELDDSFYYGASCSSCHRSKRVSLLRLRSVLGDTFPLVKVRKRLRRSTCGNRQITVMFLAPGQAGTSLQHLLERPAQ